ncbi:MAG: hypothetical protein EAZ81_06560 [Verrucomicrobia bacterium]|nr:MAG: hypothetical protein EAZ81_06560 [Verrucomicrobiota bacterium]
MINSFMPAPRLLLLTAAFGEGHNSAARNLALSLKKMGADAWVIDPCAEAAPWVTRTLCRLYRWVTTHAPHLWYKIYCSTDDMDFSRQRFHLLRKPERYLGRYLRNHPLDAVISTYPLYPYFLERIAAESGVKTPVFTVITDSMEINASWKKAPTTAWVITDPQTRARLMAAGLPEEKLFDTGFPVHPSFAEMSVLPEDASVTPFRVLYFPTSKKPHIRRTSRALLRSSPQVCLTIVMGKNLRLLYRRAMELKREFPGRVRLIGWTRRVPELLCSHHLVVGKAGGATVHEAIAAQCPMLVHHLVPGQEQGNLHLLEDLGAGALTETPEQISERMQRLLAHDAAEWRKMKRKLAEYRRNDGGERAARAILQAIGHSELHG